MHYLAVWAEGCGGSEEIIASSGYLEKVLDEIVASYGGDISDASALVLPTSEYDFVNGVFHGGPKEAQNAEYHIFEIW